MMPRKRKWNQQAESLRCEICGEWVIGGHSSLARHISHSRNHESVDHSLSKKLPAYGDPQFDVTDSRNHDSEWDRSPSVLSGGLNFNDDNAQQDLEEGPEDVIFEGAGCSRSYQKR